MQKNKSRSPLTATLTSKGKPQREISVHETQRVFVVDAWNRIFLFESAEAAVHAGFHNPFASASELGEIVGGGTARVVAIWNGLAADTTSGPVGSVTRFASRDAGLKRIWSEINRVQPPSGTAGKKTELPIPDIDIPPVIGPVIEARKVKNTETRAKVFGFPVTQAIAWMGANGYQFGEARAVLAGLGVPQSTDSTVRTYLTKGRSGAKPAANFGAEHAAAIAALRPVQASA